MLALNLHIVADMQSSTNADDLKQLLVLHHLPGMVAHRKLQLLQEGYSVHDLLHSEPFTKMIAEWGKENLVQALVWADEEMQRAARQAINIISIDDPCYPQLLLEIDDPPLILYAKGNLSLLEQLNRPVPTLGIVGARKVSAYGMQVVEWFGRELIEAGFLLVSGMAMGVDAAAHDQALKVSASAEVAPTIGFLGSGVDRVYPCGSIVERHRYDEMVVRGLLLSEYPLGYPPLPENFPRRNRLISGVSHGVLIIQAAEMSGSLITARMAAEQGRLVFAVPHPITVKAGAGGNRLIRQGATLVSQPVEIIEEIAKQVNLDLPSEQKTSMSDPLEGQRSLNSEEKILYNLLIQNQFGTATAEELMTASGLEPQLVLQLLSGLELRSLIQKAPDGRFQRRS